MGANGTGKAEIAIAEIGRAHVFCDEWEQASHGGELAAAIEAGTLAREDVTELGAVLLGDWQKGGRAGEITVFDSTGLAIQDLAVAMAALEPADELDLARSISRREPAGSKHSSPGTESPGSPRPRGRHRSPSTLP